MTTITTEAPAAAGRDVRRLVLEDLAEIELDYFSLPPRALGFLVAAAASPLWAQEEALAKFRALTAETVRCRQVEAGEPDFRDVEPAMCAADRDAILADLLDGTNTYHGDRR